jgi:hypothetical protein
MNVAAKIAELVLWNERCKKSGNTEWECITRGKLKAVMDTAPRGSGFDNGTTLDRADDARLIFNTSFHHMDEHGGYCGWSEHSVVVKIRFSGLNIHVSGQNKRGIKEYIHEVFDMWLSNEWKERSDVHA